MFRAVNKIILFYILLMCLFFSCYAQKRITLTQAISLALMENLTLKNSKLDLDITEQNLKQVQFSRLPKISASNTININSGRSLDPTTYTYSNKPIITTAGNILANIQLFRGFEIKNTILENKFLQEGSKQSLFKLRDEIKLNVLTTYIDVLNFKEQWNTSQKQLKIAKQRLDEDFIRLKTGLITESDIAQIQLVVASTELDANRLKNQLDVAMLELTQLIELPIGTNFDIETINLEEFLINKELDDSIKIETYPEIKMLENYRKAAQKLITIEKSNLYPYISLNYSLASNYSSINMDISTVPIGNVVFGSTISGEPVLTPNFLNIYSRKSVYSQLKDNFYQYVGLSVSVPIFNAYYTKVNIRKAELGFRKALINEQLGKSLLCKTLAMAKLNFATSKNNYIIQLKALDASRKAFDALLTKYKNGLVNLSTLNELNVEFNKRENEFIQSKYNMIFRKKVIDFYLGRELSFNNGFSTY